MIARSSSEASRRTSFGVTVCAKTLTGNTLTIISTASRQAVSFLTSRQAVSFLKFFML